MEPAHKTQTTHSTHPYYYLCNKIDILVVDDYKEALLQPYYEFLNNYYLYKIDFSDNFYVAQSKLETGNYHICILDLGLQNIMDDEYYLLKKFSGKIPIIVTGAIDKHKRSEAYRYGAVTIQPKPVYEDYREMSHTVNVTFLQLLAMPFGFQIKDGLVKKWCQILREKNPNNIFEWAVMGGVSESYFRKRWQQSFSLQPDYFLYLFKLFLDAFSYCNNPNKNRDHHSTYSIEYRIDRQRSFYRVHYPIVNKILNKLSACNYRADQQTQIIYSTIKKPAPKKHSDNYNIRY